MERLLLGFSNFKFQMSTTFLGRERERERREEAVAMAMIDRFQALVLFFTFGLVET